MSVRDYLKVINIQDLTTGDNVGVINCNREHQVNTSLSLYELELVTSILEILRDEHNVCLKIGYKSV